MTGVEAAGYQRSHVQGGTDPGASTPDGAFASESAAVPVEGSHSHQGGDLPAVQRAQLRQIGQEGEGELFSNAWDGAQEVVLLSPHGTLTESLPQPLVKGRPTPAQARRCEPRCGDGRRRWVAALRRFFSETSMVITWCLRAAMELRTWVSASRRGRTGGRTASAK